MIFGLHRQRPRDRHALLLAAGQLRRILVRLLRDADALEQLHADCLRVCPRRSLRTRIGASVMFCERGQVREQVERLEDHPDLAADGGDVADVVRQLDAVDDDLAALVLLEAVDGPDEGRLAGAGRRRR